MKIIRELSDIKDQIPYPILTLGNFDGIHIGHQTIFKKLVERARETGGTSIVFTFKNHTLKVLAPDKSPPLLTTFEKKIELIEKCGIDMVLCVDFTKEFANQSPRDFVKEVFVDKIGAREIIVGYDCTFGKGGEGNIDYLKNMEKEFGYRLQVVEPIRLNGYVASSSLIRNLIKIGEMDKVAYLLGRNYSLKGKVIGAKIKKPTDYFIANIDSNHELVPPGGIYIITVECCNLNLRGIIYAVNNHAVKNNGAGFKIHFFDFHGELYEGARISINFVQKIHNETLCSIGGSYL
jgi:riboflavin kinase/FMN adenylyltransferase